MQDAPGPSILTLLELRPAHLATRSPLRRAEFALAHIALVVAMLGEVRGTHIALPRFLGPFAGGFVLEPRQGVADNRVDDDGDIEELEEADQNRFIGVDIPHVVGHGAARGAGRSCLVSTFGPSANGQRTLGAVRMYAYLAVPRSASAGCGGGVAAVDGREGTAGYARRPTRVCAKRYPTHRASKELYRTW
ncbi:hypothetical protein P171DRAFT_262956 [Karstenula rhodostoma CBS 690.94]|uniref:Uncharacterized protein n=1 Tax=Karstenula rhodostoma CBS 690.94 TaxID=1392251 RepID=A0A9P4PPN4_9PLEO|nr:hypothetical protein P171DRAFT_262956 [Karstenula rhodostoma CBS 690.94]